MAQTANWYHAHQDSVKRSEGKSAVGLVSYITDQSMKNELTGEWCKRNHPGEVLFWDTVAPSAAPAYLTDRNQLSKAWNDVERSETRKNSIVAVHWNVAGSREFTEADHKRAARDIAGELSRRYGVMVTYGIHKPTDHGDDRNWHYHFGHNMRRVGADGFGEKAREIVDQKTFVQETTACRAMVADVLNRHLARIGSKERVSHLSYADRGEFREATKHPGNKQNMSELKGIETETGNENRAIRERNAHYAKEQGDRLAAIHKLVHESEIIDIASDRRRRAKKENPMSNSQDAESWKQVEGQVKLQSAVYHQFNEQYQRAVDFRKDWQDTSDQSRKDKEKLEQEAAQKARDGDITDPLNRFKQAMGRYNGTVEVCPGGICPRGRAFRRRSGKTEQ